MGAEGARRSMGTKGTRRKILFTLHPNTILKLDPNPNTHPNPQPNPNPTPPPTLAVTLTLTTIEYWDRAGGGRNTV